MQRWEMIKGYDLDKVSNYLCREVEEHTLDIEPCEVCPVRKLCWLNHNGFKAYLSEELPNVD